MPEMKAEDEAAFMQRIAEAVIGRTAERERIALWADAVLERMCELVHMQWRLGGY